MVTQILGTTHARLADSASQAAAALARGGLVAIPTDTVYGLAARADDDAAIAALFRVKRRRDDSPLPILLADESALTVAAPNAPEAARILAREFWPGPLTIVLRKAETISDLVTGGKPTVGLRIPDHAVARAVLRACDFFVAVSSANISGGPPARETDEVRRDFSGDIDLILAADRCPGGVPSTVVDISDGEGRIVRAGAISAARIQTALRRGEGDRDR